MSAYIQEEADVCVTRYLTPKANSLLTKLYEVCEVPYALLNKVEVKQDIAQHNVHNKEYY